MGLSSLNMNSIEAFDAELALRHVEGMWKLPAPPSAEPRKSLVPFLWKWSEIERDLQRAGEIVDLGPKEERRVLRLVNPGMQGRRATTHTLQMSYQLVKPGDIARAHRHTIAAIRFIVKGTGAFTTVDGTKLEMSPGDLILTPSWMFHDHGNDTDEPVVWIDGLDSPLVSYLGVGFFEHFGQERQPAKSNGTADPSAALLRPIEAGSRQRAVFKYPWQATLDSLQVRRGDVASPFDGVLLEYSNPANGGHTFPTLACCIQMLRPSEKTRAHRHTSGAAYHVVRGRGSTFVESTELAWEAGDCFVIPPWYTHWHRNLSMTSDAILFSITDAPILEVLGLFRTEPMNVLDG
jgi:gentisate 1,2-dioxygenase